MSGWAVLVAIAGVCVWIAWVRTWPSKGDAILREWRDEDLKMLRKR